MDLDSDGSGNGTFHYGVSVQSFANQLLSELMDEMGLRRVGRLHIGENNALPAFFSERGPNAPALSVVYRDNVPMCVISVKTFANDDDMHELCFYMKCLTHYYGIVLQFGLLMDATSFRIAWTPESDVVAQSVSDLIAVHELLPLKHHHDTAGLDKYRLPGQLLTESVHGTA
jgi:hypothetical protein